MFGKINLENTLDNCFKSDLCDSSKYLKTYQKCYRPHFYSYENIDLYISGTLVGQLTDDRLVNINYLDIIDKYKNSGIEKVISELEGLYFLYLHDIDNGRHLLINNRYQLSHLYYAIDSNCFYFSDRLSNILPHLSKIEPHLPSITNFLANGFNSSDQSPIKSVKKLLPTFWIDITKNKIKINNNWSKQIEFKRQSFDSLDDKLDQYERLYRKTLSNYLEMRNPEELGTLLSGGHDTSFVMIQSSKVFHKPVHAFTVVFPDWNFNEGIYAENICNKFNGVFHPIAFDANDLDRIVDLIDACEEPVLGSSLPLHILSIKASNYTDTMLGGDGGDTLWGEYYPVGEYHRWIKSLPISTRRFIHSISRFMRDVTDWERFWELEHVAGLFVDSHCYEHFMNKLCTYRHFSQLNLKKLIHPSYFDGNFQSSILEIEFNKNNFDNSLIEGKLFNAFYTYQSFQQTRSMNSCGMEFYLPTVNSEMIKFITNLPNEWVNGGNTFHRLTNNKSINRLFHKKALARYLKKEEIYNRSFDIPWYKILKPRPRLLINLKQRLINRGWYNDEYINSLFDEFLLQKNKTNEIIELKSHGYRILALLSVEVWAMQFIDGKYNQNIYNLEQYLES